mgnify:CR=1 FL=1
MRASPRASSNPDPNPEGVSGRPTTPGTPSAPSKALQGPPRPSEALSPSGSPQGLPSPHQTLVKPSPRPLSHNGIEAALPSLLKRHQKPATASGSEERTEKMHPPRNESRKCAGPLRPSRACSLRGRTHSPSPRPTPAHMGRGDTHATLRLPKAARFVFPADGNDLKNQPRHPATTPRSLRRTEKRHHSQTNRESAPALLRPTRPCPQRRRTPNPSQGRYPRTREEEIPTRP